MAGTLAPQAWFTGLDDNGVTVIGGRLYTYEAGTSTPLATYADVDLQVANPNPTILDGGARATLFLKQASYKFVLKDANDVTIRTQDNIAANAAFNADIDIAGIAGELLTPGQVAYLSVGAETPPQTAGRWYLATAATAPKSSAAQFLAIVQTTVVAGGVGSFRLQGQSTIPLANVTPVGPLTPGKVYYVAPTPGSITAFDPVTFSRVVGIADSPTTLVSATGFGTSFVVSGNSNITGNLTVGGSGTFGGDLFTSGNFLAQGNINDIYKATVRNVGGGSAGAAWVVESGTNTLSGLYAFNQLYAPAVGDTHNKPSGMTLYSSGIGGLSVYSFAGIRFYTNGVLKGAMFPSGGFNWGQGTTDPGAGPAGSGWFSSVGILVNRLTPFTALGNLQVKAFTSAGWDGLHIQLDQDVAGGRFIQFFNAAGVSQGSISATNGTTTAYNTASDARLKIDLGIPLETQVLGKLVVHDFQWKTGSTVSRGLFAQEAYEVLPEAVTPGCDGPVVDEVWQIDYSKVVPDLIVGWQEHERRMQDILARLDAVESRDAK